MKNILRTIFIFVVGALFLVSCEKKETNFDAMTKDWDPNATTYYLQFVNNSQSLQTGVSETGGFVEISTTIDVALLGNPQSAATTVTLGIDPSSTLAADMYVITGGLSVTIPAGQTSVAVPIKSVAANMPVDVPLVLKLNINDPNAAATAATATYTFKRAKFCPWTVDEMVGTYTGTDYSGYGSLTMEGAKFEVFKVDNSTIAISGFLQALYVGSWGESVSGGDRVEFTYKANGKLTTVNQYLCQTDGVWDYYIGPSNSEITWDGCSYSFDIPWFFHWDNAYGDDIACWSKFSKD